MAALAYMALVALVIGTAEAVIATGRVTASLVASTTLSWSFVPILQLLNGLVLVRGAHDGPRALGEYFVLHRPWSLWILAFAIAILIIPALGMYVLFLLVTALIPFFLTGGALKRFCQRVLELDPATARRRVRVHQAVTVALIVSYVFWGSALWPRVIRMLGI